MALKYFVPFARTDNWYNKDWPEMSNWCDERFGKFGPDTWNWSTLSPTGFWLANETHKTLFLLKWGSTR